jgi:hypothetical protein
MLFKASVIRTIDTMMTQSSNPTFFTTLARMNILAHTSDIMIMVRAHMGARILGPLFSLRSSPEVWPEPDILAMCCVENSLVKWERGSELCLGNNSVHSINFC